LTAFCNWWHRVHEICRSCLTWPAEFGQILLRTDTRLVFCNRKLMRTVIFLLGPPICDQTHMQFHEPWWHLTTSTRCTLYMFWNTTNFIINVLVHISFIYYIYICTNAISTYHYYSQLFGGVLDTTSCDGNVCEWTHFEVYPTQHYVKKYVSETMLRCTQFKIMW